MRTSFFNFKFFMSETSFPMDLGKQNLASKVEQFRVMCFEKEVDELARICDYFAMSIAHDQQLLAVASSILNSKTRSNAPEFQFD